MAFSFKYLFETNITIYYLYNFLFFKFEIYIKINRTKDNINLVIFRKDGGTLSSTFSLYSKNKLEHLNGKY